MPERRTLAVSDNVPCTPHTVTALPRFRIHGLRVQPTSTVYFVTLRTQLGAIQRCHVAAAAAASAAIASVCCVRRDETWAYRRRPTVCSSHCNAIGACPDNEQPHHVECFRAASSLSHRRRGTPEPLRPSSTFAADFPPHGCIQSSLSDVRPAAFTRCRCSAAGGRPYTTRGWSVLRFHDRVMRTRCVARLRQLWTHCKRLGLMPASAACMRSANGYLHSGAELKAHGLRRYALAAARIVGCLADAAVCRICNYSAHFTLSVTPLSLRPSVSIAVVIDIQMACSFLRRRATRECPHADTSTDPR